MSYECEACKTCEEWNHKTQSCDFSGICEEPVDPEYLKREHDIIYGERDQE